MTSIIEVEIRNVLKISYARLTPEGHISIIGGNNEQGKSSFINGVAMNLGGKKLCPSRPIKDGCSVGTVRVKLSGDPAIGLPPCTVVRKFTRGKDGSTRSELVIITDDGFSAPEPQTLLNRIVSTMTFDPRAFSDTAPREQAQTLRELAGIDDTPLRDRRAALYEERTVVGRLVKQHEGHLLGLPAYYDGVPLLPVSSGEIVEAMEVARQANVATDKEGFQLGALQQSHATVRQNIADSEREVADLEQRLVDLRAHLQESQLRSADMRQQILNQQARVDAAVYVDLSIYKQQLADLDLTNAKVRANEKRRELQNTLETVQVRSDRLTDQIKGIDSQVAGLYEQARWPIPGLGFDAEGVTYRGLPFAQCSSAEQLRVSVAIGFALNPGLKLLLIRDGSLLDDNSLAQVAAMAAEADGQVFLERVGEGNECHLILRDGAVVGQVDPADEVVEVGAA